MNILEWEVGAKSMPKYGDLHKQNNLKGKSIEEVCSATWESVYKFIYYKVQNREEAEDITQETYMKAISHIENGNVHPDKQIGFLKTVAMNVLRDLWRKKKRRGLNIDIDVVHPKISAIDDTTEKSADRIVIEQALTELNEEQRTVIELRIIKGYSVAETAHLMDKKEVTIRVLQHRAIQRLSEILNSTK